MVRFTFAPSEYHKMLEVSKVEVVCRAAVVDHLVETIVKAARTGVRGDGIVFITPVDRAVKVRTGEKGAQALANPEAEDGSFDYGFWPSGKGVMPTRQIRLQGWKARR